MELKNRIIQIIEKSGLTPSEFADKIEVQRSAISHITSGRNNPSLEFLIKIKNSFPEIDTDWLIFGIEKERNSDENKLNNFEKNSTSPTPFESKKNVFSMSEKTKHYKKPSKKLTRTLLFFDDGSFEEYLNSDLNN